MADKQTIKAYDSNVDTYKKMVSKLPDLEPLQAFIAELPQGALVLDWGSGPGYLANRMRQAGLKPVCSDASAEMVAAAQQDFGLEARQENGSCLASRPKSSCAAATISAEASLQTGFSPA